MNKREIVKLLIVLLVSFGAGYALGFSKALDMCVKVALDVTNVEVDPMILKQLIAQYGGRL